MDRVYLRPAVLASAAIVLAAGNLSLAAVERTPFKEKYPEAEEVFALVGEEGGQFRTGFPLLRKLLELKDPWKLEPAELKEAVFPQYFDPGHSFPLGDKVPTESMELICGTEESPVLFVDRRYTHDWRHVTTDEWKEKKRVDWPGLKVWDHWAYVTDFWVYNPARPLIRLHIGVAPVGWSHMMQPIMLPKLPESLRKEIPEKLDKIVEALRPYGAKNLDLKHPRIRRYLLPGGTLMTYHDKSLDFADRLVMMKIDFQPAEPIKDRTALPAFPGAEGHGAYTPGGRGGKVYIVTTLEDYLPEDRPGMEKGLRGSPGFPPIPKEDPIPGSLREAVEAEGPRIVMFGVSGTIALKAPLKIENPYLTLVGHTAPGEGVQIRNWWISTHRSTAHDLVLRYLRVRVGEIKGPGDLRRVRAEQTQALDFTGINIIVDHCEFAYGNDQIVNVRAHAPEGTLYGVTRALSSFQWNYVYGGQKASTHDKGEHSMGYILNGEGFLSFHHNLTAHVDRRNPRGGGLDFDWRNNTLYHYRNSGTGGKFLNYVGNTIKRGGQDFHWHTGDQAYVYAHDNIGGGGLVVKAPAEVIKDRPWNFEPVKTDRAAEAYDKVLKQGGADLPVRDVITTWISESVRNNTGDYCGTPADWPHGGYATYPAAEPDPDADLDGMPDWWEKKYGLDPNNAADNAGDKNKDGYTNIEEYINDTDPTEYIDYHKPESNLSSVTREDTIHRRKD